jgi:citrate lyase beta subunit
VTKYVSYFDLGATLYTPCTHSRLSAILQNGSALTRSVVLCLEDSIKEDELPLALNNLKQSLQEFTPCQSIKRFIRPRNPLVLAEILNYQHIDKIDGFVLPKFDLNTIDLYQQVIKKSQYHHFSYMPILETAQLFDVKAIISLRNSLKSWGDKVICLRIGGNDLMNLLGIKRMSGLTIYDTPLRTVIDQLIIHFRPEGFELSAPVFDIIEDLDTLAREVSMDLSYGFYAKTAIHPSQIEVIEKAFSTFTEHHLIQAERVLDSHSSAVFKFKGQMMEQSCHKEWATRTLQLAERYN